MNRQSAKVVLGFGGIVTGTGNIVPLSSMICDHDLDLFARHQFPPEVIRHAVWLYLRFTLSLRDVEEMLAERGLDLT